MKLVPKGDKVLRARLFISIRTSRTLCYIHQHAPVQAELTKSAAGDGLACFDRKAISVFLIRKMCSRKCNGYPYPTLAWLNIVGRTFTIDMYVRIVAWPDISS